MELDTHPDSQKQYLDIIKKTTGSGLSLISDLLDLSAASETTLKPTRKSFDLLKLIQEKIESYHEASQAKSITIDVATGNSALFNSDPDFVGRILDNLISNAIKFSAHHTKIQIRFGEQGNDFFFSVKDNGPGFSEKDKGQMFQKFKRLSAQPTASESSNGLGLALIKSLVDRLNGKIELISEERQGSEFIITLPNSLL
jgi:signal transduction histidine kinase